MKQTLLCVTWLLITIAATCQEKTWLQQNFKQRAIIAALGLISGGFEGKADQLQFHNFSNDPFWGQDSWRNKYVNHDPAQGQTFRGRYLTFTTDGYHLMKFCMHATNAAAVAIPIFGKKQKWWVYAMDGFFYWAFNRAGFNIVYNHF